MWVRGVNSAVWVVWLGKVRSLLGVTADRGWLKQTRRTAVGLHSYSLAYRLSRQSLLGPNPPSPPSHLPLAVHN